MSKNCVIRGIIWIFLSLTILSSCGKKSNSKQELVLTQGKGGRNYGGIFKLNESEYIKTLFPPGITDAFSYRVSTQIYEGLFKFDQRDLTLENCLAESYTIDSTGLVYTFKIKKGVKFRDDDCFDDGKGREMTAEDVKFCFTYLCSNDINNHGYSIFKNKLKGATAYHNAFANGQKPNFEVEGLKVLDPFTIQLTLERKNALFLYDLARPFAFIYPKEALEKYGLEMRVKSVGTGPFYISQIEDDISIILKKNEFYHGVDSLGNKLPFLDAIKLTFIKEKKSELLEFKKGNMDMIYRLPTEDIIDIVEEAFKRTRQGEYSKYTLQRKPEMATHFLTFLNQSELFKNKDLRLAFSYAIDREKILNYVLQGEGYKAGFNGVTPPIFPGYDIENIKGFGLNIDSARYFLKKAGYPNGVGLPKITLELNADGDRNVRVAEEVQKELKDNLNISIELNIVPFAQHVENITLGKSNFFRIGWIADFPSPETFLSLFYGKDVPNTLAEKSFPNMSRFKNDEFDKYYELALASTNQKDYYANFYKAEKILMREAPVIVLWYDECYRLLQPTVQNFPSNPMQYRDFSQVYFEVPKQLKED